jgi:uncharacterized membrane protein YkvA (DUF1232 family)
MVGGAALTEAPDWQVVHWRNQVTDMDEKHNWIGPYIPEGSIFRELIQQVKLAYNLMLDPRVNPLTKLIPVAALAYLILPTDIAPDFVPVLGQLDDVAILLFGLRMFFELAPSGVVEEHLKRLVARVRGDWTVTDEVAPGTPAAPPAGEVIDDEE